MSQPKVSILLPNLNNQAFLEERFKTIINQSFTNWELIVIDSYSEDGAWEIIQRYAQQDPRINSSQAPRQGVYPAINNCVRLARGEYVYIATSDDTMRPDCLEKMVSAIETYPECDICHSCLQVIDEKGRELRGVWERMPVNRFYGSLMQKKHIRQAPYDGLLYCGVDTVYTSLTQLLIRRSVFDKIGLFKTDWGSKSDFEWGMRAALVCNTLHWPETLATWRIHPQQATTSDNYISSKHRTALIEMVQAALPTLEKYNPDLYHKLSLDKLLFIYRRQRLRLALKECQNITEKITLTLHNFVKYPRFLSEFIYRKLFFARDITDDFIYLRQELDRLGLRDCVKILE